MNFLHKSDIKVHGNLKSKNCMVNNRWTVKLQDYGPRCLVKHPQSKNGGEPINYWGNNCTDLVNVHKYCAVLTLDEVLLVVH